MDERIAEAHRMALADPLSDEHLCALLLEDPACLYYRLLYRLARLARPEVMVELGVCTGRGTAHLAAGCPDGLVIAVDPEEHGALRPNALDRYPNIRFCKARSDDHALLASVADGSVGLCFVDSVHAVDYALREVALWTPKMKKGGGVFLFDDLEWDEGMRGLLARLPFVDKGDLPGMHVKGFGYAVV